MMPVSGQGSAEPGPAGCVPLPASPSSCDRPEPPALSSPSSLRGPTAPQAHLHACSHAFHS